MNALGGFLERQGPQLSFNASPATTLPSSFILGLPFNPVSMEEAILAIMERLYAEQPSHVCFLNAHCVNVAWQNQEYVQALHAAAMCFPDGSGLRLAGDILGQPVPHNVNGTDLFPLLCAALEETDAGVFLFGGQPGVAEGVQHWLELHYPEVQIRGLRHGYFSPEEEPLILRQITDSGARLLLVALGAPFQDLWINRHLFELATHGNPGIKVAMGVGGLFDFYSGRLPRAPLWLRRRGGEWLYRLYQEPGRMWRRYVLGNPLFLFRVLRARWSRTSQNSDTSRWAANVIPKHNLP
jgi:N-acetylglucosaminyldiphosphoundecaprenol N-acetyl-beta-D-mannosaminyltransferase